MGVEITGANCEMVMVSVACVVPVAFVAETSAGYTPALPEAGVPVMRPPALMLRPLGSPVALHVIGPLIPVIWYGVNATESPPAAVSGELVTTGSPSVIVNCTVKVALVPPNDVVPVTWTGVGPPTAVGVPLMTQPVRLRPVGSEPETILHEV